MARRRCCCKCRCPEHPDGILGIYLEFNGVGLSIPIVEGVDSYSGTVYLNGPVQGTLELDQAFWSKHDGIQNPGALVVQSAVVNYLARIYMRYAEIYKFTYSFTYNRNTCKITGTANVNVLFDQFHKPKIDHPDAIEDAPRVYFDSYSAFVYLVPLSVSSNWARCTFGGTPCGSIFVPPRVDNTIITTSCSTLTLSPLGFSEGAACRNCGVISHELMPEASAINATDCNGLAISAYTSPDIVERRLLSWSVGNANLGVVNRSICDDAAVEGPAFSPSIRFPTSVPALFYEIDTGDQCGEFPPAACQISGGNPAFDRRSNRLSLQFYYV